MSTSKTGTPRGKIIAFYLLLLLTLGVSLGAQQLNRAFPIPLGGQGYAARAILAFAFFLGVLLLSAALQKTPLGGSAWAFIVITSSPVNVIPYASGCFTPGDMARRGVVMTILAAVIIAFWLAVLHVC